MMPPFRGIKIKISKSEKGHNFVNIHNRVMLLGYIVALVTVNKCVKFHKISFNNVYKLTLSMLSMILDLCKQLGTRSDAE